MANKISDKRIRQLIFDKYNGKCAYCGCELIKMSIDHIEPLRRDLDFRYKDKKGSDAIENYNPCCYSCNSSKCSLTLEEFRKQIEGRHEFLLKYSSEYRSMVRFNRIQINTEQVKFYFEIHNG